MKDLFEPKELPKPPYTVTGNGVKRCKVRQPRYYKKRIRNLKRELF